MKAPRNGIASSPGPPPRGRSPFRCIACGARAGCRESRCRCGGLLEVPSPVGRFNRSMFEARRGGRGLNASGVWRFRELVAPGAGPGAVTREEGNTPLYRHASVAELAGVRDVVLKHEGENPTGSFKDRGMTVAVTQALRWGATHLLCASTGNTAASLASYAALAGLPCTVLLPRGQVAPSKLSQTLAYGARLEEVDGSFDDALEEARQRSERGNAHLVNSLNPWRIEGQKTIALELLEERGWDAPDWVCLPAGNLGNLSALGKGFLEARALGLSRRVPRLLAVQAEGASPFYRLWKHGGDALVPETRPETGASAIRIGNPVSWPKALRVLRACGGEVEAVPDREIFAAKRVIDRAGIGCEAASAAALAGLRRARRAGTVAADDRVVCVLTGHLLKGTAEPNPGVRTFK